MLDPKDGALLRALAERTLQWQQGSYYWGDAIAYDGLLDADDRVGGGYSAELARRLQRWAQVAPDSWDDALAPGQAAARLVAAGTLPESVLQRVVEALLRLPLTSEGLPLLRPHVPEWRDLVWVDSLYHLPSSLVAAGQVLEREALIETGVERARALLRVLENGPAVAHAFDCGLGRSNDVLWTRGIGWALLGALDVTARAPEAASAAGLPEAAQRLVDALSAEQREDGHFPTVLGHAGATCEASTAAFWTAAAHHPARPVTSESARRLAVSAVRAGVGPDGSYLNVSHDTHVRWEVIGYLDPPRKPSPWGQGAALRALASAAGGLV